MTVPARRPRRRLTRMVLILCCLMASLGFAALGKWQLERRVWKLDLIERVDARVHAPAVSAPGRDEWQAVSSERDEYRVPVGPNSFGLAVSRERDEYRHVRVSGYFLPGRDTRVAGATELGTGYWVLSPLQRDDGTVILINRGFVSQGVLPSPAPEGEVTVTGLLRLPETDGGVLRDNVPAEGRWYSRDVAAIAATLDLPDAAPYFIDAAAGSPGSPGSPDSSGGSGGSGGGPVGGLTVIHFYNSHLVYAITWFGLTAMSLGACYLLIRKKPT